MKTIGIDARLYFQTGVGVYVRNLIYELQHLPLKDEQFIIYVLDEERERIQLTDPHFIVRPVSERWHTLAEQITFLQTLYRDKLDLMHFTYFSHPIFYNRKFVSTIHDATLLLTKTGSASTHHPILYQIKHQAFVLAFKHQINSSISIITPTKTVQNQLTSLFGKQYEKKIYPVYEGVDRELIQAKENTQLEKTLPKKYFLYVGNFYPHKNVERLIDAYGTLNGESSLILVGPKNYFFDRLQSIITSRGLRDKIILFPNATNSDLVYLYKHAICYVQPSLSEGFGLPVIEATYFGCPVVVSSIPVFKEIAPYAAMFNPYDTGDIRSVLQKYEKESSTMRAKISDEFSFKVMAQKTLNIYRQAISHV